MDAPDIRWSTLASEAHHGDEELSEAEIAYNEAAFMRAVTEGIAPGGASLSRDMPRWRIGEGDLDRLPTAGNQHNVFLTVLTIAGLHALLSSGIERQYALELFGDVGWQLYSKYVSVPRFLARLVTCDPQKQIELILRSFMIFPFSAPGRPGYEVETWAEANQFCTYWTNCPPLEFVKRYIARNGDGGELEAFYETWCSYDWAFTYVMIDGKYGERGHYERPYTLFVGDEVCDMCCSAVPH